MSEIKLRPCPFCGGGVHKYVETDPTGERNIAYWCSPCGVLMNSVESWNRRPIEDALLAACEDMLDAALDCNDPEWHKAWRDEIDAARAAIKLAKGGS